LEINLKIRERFSSVNEIENLNNFVKNWEIDVLNCLESEISILLEKIDIENSSIRENEIFDESWTVLMKLLLISSIIEQQLKVEWKEIKELNYWTKFWNDFS
jgi:hypothetical protein